MDKENAEHFFSFIEHIIQCQAKSLLFFAKLTKSTFSRVIVNRSRANVKEGYWLGMVPKQM